MMALPSLTPSSILIVSLLHVATAAAAASTSVDLPVNQSLLARQIGGIVGAYVLFVTILLSLLLAVGRRLRRRVESSSCTLEVEMMKPTKKPAGGIDPNAQSPNSNKQRGFTRSWSSLTKGAKSHVSNVSEVTFDESVMASDRERGQKEMENLYAAVMEYDAKRAAGIDDTDVDYRHYSPTSPATNPFDTPPSQREGPFFGQDQKEDTSDTKAPTSPRSSSRLSKISPLTLFNSNSRSSADSDKARSPRRLSIRKLPISPPVASPTYGEDQQPLSPRCYNPGPPPLAPHHVQASQGKTGRAPAPAPLNLSPGGGSRGGNGGRSTSSLPFREAYPLQSAPATKTTILERPAHLGVGPRTGAPTPYSPYMPFTPVTPITPSRMVTRRERKREVKGNGLRVLHEDDLVKGDNEVWGY